MMARMTIDVKPWPTAINLQRLQQTLPSPPFQMQSLVILANLVMVPLGVVVMPR